MSDQSVPADSGPGSAADADPSTAPGEPATTPTGDVARPSAETSDLDREGDVAADYLEALLDIADFDGDIDIDVEGDRASVAVIGTGLGRLVGERGATLEALQELARLAVTRRTGQRSRLMLDIGGYRAQRRNELAELARHTAEQVRATSQPVALEAMTAFERKVVHDAVSAIDGVRSESEGIDPDRHIVVHPA